MEKNAKKEILGAAHFDVLKYIKKMYAPDALIAGGAVRDMVMEKPFKDVDIWYQETNNKLPQRFFEIALPRDLGFNPKSDFVNVTKNFNEPSVGGNMMLIMENIERDDAPRPERERWFRFAPQPGTEPLMAAEPAVAERLAVIDPATAEAQWHVAPADGDGRPMVRWELNTGETVWIRQDQANDEQFVDELERNAEENARARELARGIRGARPRMRIPTFGDFDQDAGLSFPAPRSFSKGRRIHNVIEFYFNGVCYQLMQVSIKPFTFIKEDFDIGFCKIAHNGNEIIRTKEFEKDFRDKTFTLSGKILGPKNFEWAMKKHIPRLQELYPDFKVNVVSEPEKPTISNSKADWYAEAYKATIRR